MIINLNHPRIKLRVVTDKELFAQLDDIIQTQPVEKQEAFYGTTVEAILGGANYNNCKNIRDMATVYSLWLVNKFEPMEASK